MQANSSYGALAEAIAPSRGLARFTVLAALVAGGSAFTTAAAQFRWISLSALQLRRKPCNPAKP